VLAGLMETKGDLDQHGKELINLASEDGFTSEVGEQLLKWLYSQQTNWDPKSAKTGNFWTRVQCKRQVLVSIYLVHSKQGSQGVAMLAGLCVNPSQQHLACLFRPCNNLLSDEKACKSAG